MIGKMLIVAGRPGAGESHQLREMVKDPRFGAYPSGGTSRTNHPMPDGRRLKVFFRSPHEMELGANLVDKCVQDIRGAMFRYPP